MKRFTKKRLKETSAKLVKQIKVANSLTRIESLHKRAVTVNWFQCKVLNPKFDLTQFKVMPITYVLKLTQWYSDQAEARRDAIMISRSFCCPISGEILDMNRSFLINYKNRETIISENGLNSLIEKNPKIIEKVLT